ncbi:Peptidoglycan/xylan/chitin deacetylase, PgdA/CDA1 family [Natronincola peptidivorans]|uniref:Peptidoglycan/xylan/chitin deacetylase, PgdA/CDA1 family n=1 Tax=Natronincola peptidivorans TaxID=426128 RepID=A0A1I0G2T7_9FIRM|nr:LysM peptidoglycan-binding domain-containing protein [Natronincola peptidivorans]SET64896.1 Peptidoglycan/xylan/chitin deacetylase, PgdA/CDA1 family [Natronincola peptidivorans]
MKKQKKVLLYISIFSIISYISSVQIFIYGDAPKKPFESHSIAIAQVGLMENPVNIEELKRNFTNQYSGHVPQQWGENVRGVKTRIDTTDKVIALTFDACGQGGHSNGYDKKLIDFLNKEQIPATLFISGRWIDVNPSIFRELAQNPLFDIENHGHRHVPLSVNGKSAYGIKGTTSIGEVVEEIVLNGQKIQNITGKKPRYFRSGTAYYDEVAVKIANDLGYEVINYNVLGDAGATFTREQVRQATLSATSGSIILFHMNRPETNIAEGIIDAIPELIKRGFRFVKLQEYHDRLAPRTPAPGSYFYYTVVSGDSLWAIGTRYGATIQEIQNMNQLQSNILRVGQRLQVPAKDTSRLVPPVEVNHQVVSGDSLWGISNRYKTSLNLIYQRNSLNQNTVLQIGQRVIVPIEATHVVARGDTLWHISLRYGVSLQQIYDRNNLNERSVLAIGQRIMIPPRPVIW